MKLFKTHFGAYGVFCFLSLSLAIFFSSCQKDSKTPEPVESSSKVPTSSLATRSFSLAATNVTPAFPTSFTWVAPISLSGKSFQTIRGVGINGGTGPCISLNNCHDIHITKSQLQNNGAITGAIYLYNCYNIYIDTCIIANAVRGVLATRCTNNIRIVYNRIYNTTDPNLMKNGGGNAVQLNNCNGTGMRIDSNFIYDPYRTNYVGDKISLYQCNGTASSYIRVWYNHIRGGSSNPAGFTGIALGDAGQSSYQDAEYNIACSTGNVGMVIGGGQHMIMSNNSVYGARLSPSSAGIMAFNNTTQAMSDININYNKINWTNSANAVDNYWYNPTAGAVKSTGNTTPGKGDPTITDAILPNPLF